MEGIFGEIQKLSLSESAHGTIGMRHFDVQLMV